MNSTLNKNLVVPATANYIQKGTGTPVILIHGLAASHHDWDDLIPELSQHGYASYALDLLGHGESPKIDSRAYQMDWILDHLSHWINSLHLTQPAILIGHSLGGFVALDYARRFSARTKGLILVNPFYSMSQLPPMLRRIYLHPRVSSLVVKRTPSWMFRFIVDMTSLAMGHSLGAVHSLPERIRAQTALDYARTSSGVYHILSEGADLSEHLSSISVPTMVVWGEHDQTLKPASFKKLVNQMPRAVGKCLRAGHVPHQSNAAEFNHLAIEFLKTLS